ncbi:MAG TPA: M55 family metallopeptidase [Thermomicrobiales bacterium]|jgi:D-amino peptidase|nr:M55 family metallopeptidase [Thermomicrobiales bacterium]
MTVKVLISADMEGTCGVVSWTQVMPPEVVGGREPISQDRYFRTRERMTAEVNAAVEGALAGGADEVIVNDSHDGMRNLIPEQLHPEVRFITGNDKPLGMVQGVDLDGVGAVFYTGYHAKAGTPAAPLAHTWTGWLNDVRLGGTSTGEFGINAAVAGHFGIPVVLVTGDSKAVVQTQALLGEHVVGAVVKEGISTFSALHLHPLKAQQVIREAAEAAIRQLASARPFTLEAGRSVELEFDHQARADQAVLVPGVSRTGERSVAWIPEDGHRFILTFRAMMKCAAISMSP